MHPHNFALFSLMAMFLLVHVAEAQFEDRDACVASAISAAQTTASDPATAAAQALTDCGDDEAANIAEQFSAAFPDSRTKIVVAMAQARPDLSAEIVLSALNTVPEESREGVLDNMLIALLDNVDDIDEQPAFAALLGTAVPTSALLPTAGNTLFQQQSPN